LGQLVRERDEALALLKERDAEIAMLRGNDQPDCGDVTGLEGEVVMADTETRSHFYKDVPRLGNVAVSRHAQAGMIATGITQESFDKVLLHPTRPDIPDGADILWRERDGLRIVILTNPTPNTGAKLVKTVYRIEKQAKAHI
jgi:hypothetical protein